MERNDILTQQYIREKNEEIEFIKSEIKQIEDAPKFTFGKLNGESAHIVFCWHKQYCKWLVKNNIMPESDEVKYIKSLMGYTDKPSNSSDSPRQIFGSYSVFDKHHGYDMMYNDEYDSLF